MSIKILIASGFFLLLLVIIIITIKVAPKISKKINGDWAWLLIFSVVVATIFLYREASTIKREIHIIQSNLSESDFSELEKLSNSKKIPLDGIIKKYKSDSSIGFASAAQFSSATKAGAENYEDWVNKKENFEKKLFRIGADINDYLDRNRIDKNWASIDARSAYDLCMKLDPIKKYLNEENKDLVDSLADDSVGQNFTLLKNYVDNLSNRSCSVYEKWYCLHLESANSKCAKEPNYVACMKGFDINPVEAKMYELSLHKCE